MKIDRLIGILAVLMQKEKTTAPELAEKFEVSRRTITRDIEDLSKAGIPIVTLQGHGGGIAVTEGYKIDSSIFTYEEMSHIIAGLKGIESVVHELPKNTYEKLKADKSKYFSENNYMMIDLASHYKSSLSKKIDFIKKGINEKRVVKFNYYYSKGEAVKEVEPYLIVFKWSAWYLYGFCLKNNDFRMYKINRLWNISLTDKTYEYREIDVSIIDYEQYYKESGVAFKGVFKDSIKYRLIEEYGIDSYETLEDGSILFQWDFVNYDALKSWVMSFGAEVKVLSPQCLKEDIKNIALKLLEIYDE